MLVWSASQFSVRTQTRWWLCSKALLWLASIKAQPNVTHTDMAWHGSLQTICGCTRSQGALARCGAQGFVHKPASVRARAATLLSCLAFLGRDLGTARRWADAALDADASCPAALVNKVGTQTLPSTPTSFGSSGPRV